MLLRILLYVAVTASSAPVPGVVGGTLPPSSLTVSSSPVFTPQFSAPVAKAIQYTISDNVVPVYTSSGLLATTLISSRAPITAVPVPNVVVATGPGENSVHVISQGVASNAENESASAGSPPPALAESQPPTAGGQVIIEELPDKVNEVILVRDSAPAPFPIPLQEDSVNTEDPARSATQQVIAPDNASSETLKTASVSHVEEAPADIQAEQVPQARSAAVTNLPGGQPEATSGISFPPAPKETYAMYYTGPVIVRQ